MTEERNETVRPLRTRDIVQWDDTADVVIVGSGCAGASAASGCEAGSPLAFTYSEELRSAGFLALAFAL